MFELQYFSVLNPSEQLPELTWEPRQVRFLTSSIQEKERKKERRERTTSFCFLFWPFGAQEPAELMSDPGTPTPRSPRRAPGAREMPVSQRSSTW